MFPKFDKVINDDPQPTGSTSANTCVNAVLAVRGESTHPQTMKQICINCLKSNFTYNSFFIPMAKEYLIKELHSLLNMRSKIMENYKPELHDILQEVRKEIEEIRRLPI